jgi:hypothetical protein
MYLATLMTNDDPEQAVIERRQHYDLCKPALFRLYTEDELSYIQVAHQIKKYLRFNLPVIERDMKTEAAAERQASPAPVTQGQQKQADHLVALAADAELWHTPEDEPYATIEGKDHKEHRSLNSKHFRRWLRQRYYDATGRVPGSQAVQDALNTLEGIAQLKGPEHSVFVRVAEHAGCRAGVKGKSLLTT